MNAIGQPISRFEGQLKVTGGARYMGDVSLPGLTHAAIVYSTIANGRTRPMRLERVEVSFTLLYSGAHSAITCPPN